jgi:hypothetical protein
MRRLLTIALLLCAAAPAHAGDDESGDQQVVVVNAATKLGSVGQIARLRRVLDSRNMLVRLDKNLEATLDGSNALIADVDAIREAYGSADYALALRIIDTDEQRILGEAVSRDPVPALAELSQWRGIIAAAMNQQDDAVGWFRAAYRFNPAWVIDKKLASPRVRSLVKRAKREPDETGTLRVYTDPDDARVSVDGGETRAAGDKGAAAEKIELPVGKHLVMITAPKRKPYAELVDIANGKTERIDINLDDESTLDRAARLVDETAAAPAGKPRLKRAKALAKLTGVPRLLVIEDGGEDHVLVRLYDVETKKVSQALEVDGSASSAVIARQIVAALDPDNLVDVNTIVVAQRGRTPTPWYKRWYVWAAVGAVAVGGYATYDYMSREPTMVRGF